MSRVFWNNEPLNSLVIALLNVQTSFGTLKLSKLRVQLIRDVAEEVENASLNVPLAMWWSFVLNVVMGLAMLVTMLFCIGDLNAAINSSAPYLILFRIQAQILRHTHL